MGDLKKIMKILDDMGIHYIEKKNEKEVTIEINNRKIKIKKIKNEKR